MEWRRRGAWWKWRPLRRSLESMVWGCSGAGHSELVAAAEGGEDDADADDEDGDEADCRTWDMFVIMRETWSVEERSWCCSCLHACAATCSGQGVKKRRERIRRT